MLSTDSGIFLQFPGESTPRILHPAMVVRAEADSCTVQLSEPELCAKAGQEILVLHRNPGRFVQQPARIDAVVRVEPQVMIALRAIGEPVCAETRDGDRVSTVMAGLTAHFGSEHDCPVLDVSARGFSVVATEHYANGRIVPARLEYEDRQYVGTAVVQSIRELGGGKARYGLHCVDNRKASGNLRKGLQRISSTIRDGHLRRAVVA